MLTLGHMNLCGRIWWQWIVRCKKKELCSAFYQNNYTGKNNNTNIVSRKFLHTSRTCHKYFPQPGPLEAGKLLHDFPEPIKLVEDLLLPLVSVNPSSQPSLTFKPCQKATKWKAILCFTDPVPFTVIGCAQCYDNAKTNVYLQACQMFWFLGLVRKSSQKIAPANETVQSLIAKLSRDNFNIFKCFQITFDQLNVNGQKKWQSTLEIFWPHNIKVSAICDTPPGAEYKCHLLTIIKLKHLGFLNTSNDDIKPYSLIKLPVALNNNTFDYHIYFDASKIGFGAYLFSPDNSDVNWFHEHWPDFINQELKENAFKDSTFMELYAMVAALYTWKHKFTDQSVLCYSDNLAVVSLVHNGLSLIKKKFRYEKLFKILKGITHTYHILLGAKHIQRESNTAADFLSRSEVEEFRKIVPNTRENAKKSKKLLFCLPLK